jgi:hypothetical protein
VKEPKQSVGEIYSSGAVEVNGSRRGVVGCFEIAYHNFCRVHQTLRITLSMEAGLTDRVWSWEELMGLSEQKASEVAA